MRDRSLFIVALGVILVNVCSCKAQNFGRSSEDEPLRMASDSLVVKSYKDDEEAPVEEVDYKSYQGVMGRPGVDFPVLRNIPATDFNCRDVKRPGYYADLATDCQVFHICDGGRKISFLCPNGTIFRQSHLICDWWFRVDCGKSVELYEESAEQLAADQKIYQARSIERERRRKLGKQADGGEEDTAGEVYTPEESFNTRSRTRNSKKVVDSKSAEKFPNYYRGSKDENKANDDRIRFHTENDGRGFNKQGFNNNNNQGFNNHKQGFNNNNNNQDFKSNSQGFSNNNNNQGFSNNNNQDFNSNSQGFNNNNNQDFNTNSQGFSNNNQGFNNNQGASNANYQSQNEYTPSTYSPSSYKSRNFGDSSRYRENIQGAESGSLVGNLRSRHENSLQYDAKLSEFKQRVTPTTERPFNNFRTTTEAKAQDFFRSTTEGKKQDFFRTTTEAKKQDYFRTTTARADNGRRFYEGTSSTTRAPQPNRGQNVFRSTQKYVSTEKYTTQAPVRFFSTTESKRFSTARPGTSTPRPFFPVTQSTQNYRKASNDVTTRKVPADAFYYGAFTPKKDKLVSSTPRIDISLSQLNINKPTPQPSTGAEIKKFEEIIREGLEIPPSSGPNALRSFALYFAGKGDYKKGADEAKDLFYIPTVTEFEEKLNTTLEEMKQEIAQRVDSLVKAVPASGDGASAVQALPNSLTQQTRESYSALFDKNHNQTSTEPDYGTTAFETYTEEAERINVELKKNDLDGSQSRGLLEQEAETNPTTDELDEEFSKVSPDLRELAQVFTKALSAYLDDPEAFRKVLSEIRPTEPSATEASTNPVEYPSVTQEDDEVLDFSDVTKTSYRRRTTTVAYRETTTEYPTEVPTTIRDSENFVVNLNPNQTESHVKVPDVELTAPLQESLDESQSSYYTPAPIAIGTTNAIAEEINSQFGRLETLPEIDSNEAVDSYLPLSGSVDDKSRPRYGGFQNNTNYSPYGADLTTTTTTTTTTTSAPVTTKATDDVATTFNPRNITSSILFRKKPEPIVKTSGEESSLAKELNSLAELLEEQTLSSPVPKFESIKLGNGETVERLRTRSTTARPLSSTRQYQPQELSIELSPPFDTDPSDGYFGFDAAASKDPAEDFRTTTGFPTTVTEHITEHAETFPPTSYPTFESNTDSYSRFTTEELPAETATPKSFERIAELQQTLMFNSHNVTHQQMEKARITVAEAVDNMTDTTANALMKMMEMAAKNETYRRLVLLLVNDKSGKNKTVEETRLALLRALLMPVISTTRTRRLDSEPSATLPPTTTTTTTTTEAATTAAATTTTTLAPTTIKDAKRRAHFRRSKSIGKGETGNVVRVTTESPKERAKNGRRTKTRVFSRIVKTTEIPATTLTPNRLTNLELINRTIENSKTKEIKNNSLEDAILDSDSRAVELLRSLYSLAARWG